MSRKSYRKARQFEDHSDLIRAADAEIVDTPLERIGLDSTSSVRQTKSAPNTPYRYVPVRERVDSFSWIGLAALNLTAVFNMSTLDDDLILPKRSISS